MANRCELKTSACPRAEKTCVIKKAKMSFDMSKFVRPDQPSKCTWKKGADPKSSPHSTFRIQNDGGPIPNILHHIGNTPMVKLNKIPQSYGIKCDVYAKCEFFNPGGSVKDRIAFRMVEDAEKQGLLKPGYTIIEPTSGNTGIGLALAAAIKGYRCIIVMPEKMSNEKVDTLKALGAEIIRTPTAASFESPEGLIVVSQKLQSEIPNSIILDQYRNPGNPLAHYDTTAAEILEAFNGKVDMVVAGAGTGGTVCGIGRRMKDSCPSCIVVAADPEGSILSLPESLNKTDVTYYEVEGIGYDFVPTVLDRSVADLWVKVNDQEALPMAKRIIKDEGLLCGGSSGCAMAAALKAASRLKEGQVCVVVLPDGIRNYMTKFVSDHWMEARNLQECVNTQNHWWWDEKVSKLPLQPPMSLLPSTTCAKTLNVMKKQGYDQMPIVDKNGTIEGMATITTLMGKLVNSFVKPNCPISKTTVAKYNKVNPNTSLGLVSRMLEKDTYVLVTDMKDSKEVILGIVTNIDLLHYITEKEAKNGSE
ncbi:PREDICTED: cystathionine beta-synthase [Nicrophorus vespilloides]|uniref:Cystathionine beta-synthase n=1 Tax=Nicrophorus vespilloides TaxID=110193 RepID=A0ABM1M3R0_NICVS|nr:PREDICTED: cystathionine beta-synthase [Nicrophorus vespilloides]